jgi:Flp pilus assembly protein TadG
VSRIILADLMRSLSGAIVRIFEDKSGATATLVAIALPALIGLGALGAETGLWFTIKLQNQSAADAAAIAAAYQIIAGEINVATELMPAASKAAAQNRYTGDTPAVSYPYNDQNVSNGVSVALRQTREALLAAMFLTGVTVVTRAAAVIEMLDNPCILALGISGTGVEIADLARLDMPYCSVVANSISRSAIALHSSTSSIAAATLVTAGEISLQGEPIDPAALPPELNLGTLAMIGAPTLADPYAGVLTHSFLTTGMPAPIRCRPTQAGGLRTYTGNCTIPGTSLNQPAIKLSANTQISGSWSIPGGHTVDLSPGTYWITDGDLSAESGAVLKCSACDNVRGAGVTIILTAERTKIGTMWIDANAEFDLNAPRSGRFSGLVLVQDANRLPSGTRYTSSQGTMGGRSGSTINGLVYFPNSSVTFHGKPSAAGPKCLLVVVSALIVDAPSNLDSGGCANAGLTDSDDRYCCASRVKSSIGMVKYCWPHKRGWRLPPANNHGSVAAEFALMAPMMILIAAGIADFGMLATKSVGMAATTRIGAQYARLHPLDTSGIQSSMQSAMSFAPALTFPASFPLSCECPDDTPIACSESCATAGRPGPNQVFVRISANQVFTPVLPWPGIPRTLTATTKVRLQ